MRGLIAGVMGGAAKGYTQYANQRQEIDLKKEMMEAEQDMRNRADELRRERDRADKMRDIQEIDPLKAASEANRKRVVGAAETDVLAGREDALRPGKAETKKAEILAAGDATRANDAAYASDPSARAGVRARTTDSESSSSKVSAAATSDRNNREQLEFERGNKARDAAARYHDAVARGDEAEAQAARLESIRLGADPASAKKGALKVTEDDLGRKILVHEDDKGNVTRVDTGNLPAYGGKGSMPAPKSKAEFDKLAPGTRYTAPDGTIRIKQ